VVLDNFYLFFEKAAVVGGLVFKQHQSEIATELMKN